MIDPTVREFDLGRDVELLQSMEAEARAAVAELRGGDRWLAEHDPVGSGWVEAAASADVLVAHIDGVPVGYLVARLGGDRIVRVEQVWVTPEARELGFGDELLATAIDRARRAGAVGVEGWSLPGDRHTKNLYERAGVVARLITTYKAF